MRAPAIIEFDPLEAETDAIFLATCDVNDASGRAEMGELHTPYTADELRARQRVVTDRKIIFFAAIRDDEVVGEAILQMPLVDNPHLAYAWLSTRPDRRRTGVGSALVRHLERTARVSGRTILCVESLAAVERPSTLEYFAHRHGFVAAQASQRNDLVIRRDAAGRIDGHLANVDADVARHEATCGVAYELVTWWGAVPAEWLDDRAILFGRMITDAPTGDVDVTEEVWDADRVTEHGRIAHEQGRRMVETAAVDPVTRHLVGVSTMFGAPPDYINAYQGDTLVVTEHRGHRLGQKLKAANIRALAAALPGVERVITFNAEDNVPMLRINEALGFAPVAESTTWQKHLGPPAGSERRPAK